MNLKNKVIIITGATSGIGLEILKEALSLNALVMIHTSPNSEKKAKELVKQYKNKTDYVIADLSNFDDLENIVSKTVKKFGKVDGLVNNAGVFPRNNLLNINENDYDYIMNVNFKAPLFLSQKVVKVFLDKKIKGVIVNIGSINAYCGQDDLLVYSSSKGALMTLTRNMADFLGKHQIRVNQLNVGWVHTDKENKTQLNEGKDKDWFKNINKAFAPRGTILSPQEIAKHTVFWLSDYSSPVSGSIYEVEQYPVIGRNKINV